MATPADVLSYWFGAPAKNADELKAKLAFWFRGGPEVDATIAREFGAEVRAAIAGGLEEWMDEPKGWLALVVVLDQLTRNVFRGDARTHAGDARAVRITMDALAAGKIAPLPVEERQFALMPLLHAEDPACQARFAKEIRDVVAAAPDDLKKGFSAGVEQSDKYTEIIRRFGRFPHRNAILGRASTPEEEEFLAVNRAR